jgi:hypothetical protein
VQLLKLASAEHVVSITNAPVASLIVSVMVRGAALTFTA